MLLRLFQNINALSMFVIITVIGISIYTILTYKSLILFEKDIYRMKSQISAIGLAVQDLMKKDKNDATPAKTKIKQDGGRYDEVHSNTPPSNFVQSTPQPHQGDSTGTHIIMSACPIMPPPSFASSEGRSRENENENENEDGKIEEYNESGDDDDDDVSKEEIAKLKNLIANMKSDDEEEEEKEKEEKGQNQNGAEDKSRDDSQEVEGDEISLAGIQISNIADEEQQDESIESFIRGHDVDEVHHHNDKDNENNNNDKNQNASFASFATLEELQVMKYEDLRQYLRTHFGISQSRGTKADLIRKIRDQIENSIM